MFGTVAAIIQNMYSRYSSSLTQKMALKKFIIVHKLPRQIKGRLLEFYQSRECVSEAEAREVGVFLLLI